MAIETHEDMLKLYRWWQSRFLKGADLSPERMTAIRCEILLPLWSAMQRHPDALAIIGLGEPSTKDAIMAELLIASMKKPQSAADRNEKRAWWAWLNSNCNGDPPPTENAALKRLAAVLKWQQSHLESLGTDEKQT